MVEFFRQLFEGITDAWKRLTINARVQIALAATLTLVLIAAVVIIGGQPQYVRLHSRLDIAESVGGQGHLAWMTCSWIFMRRWFVAIHTCSGKPRHMTRPR